MSAQPQATPGKAPGHSMATGSVASHVRIIAILELVWGAFAAIAALAVLVGFLIATIATSASDAPGFVPGIIVSFGLLIFVLVGLLAFVALMGGSRLLKLRRSGRTFSYICAALSLVSFPIGTAFGIYAFIILTKPETDQLLVDP